MNEKLLQYRDGAAFVREIVQDAGMDQFNRVWDSPEALPTLEEIHDPQQWRSRVVGVA